MRGNKTDSNLNKHAQIRRIIVVAFNRGREAYPYYTHKDLPKYRRIKVEACQELETEIEALITEESHRARIDELKFISDKDFVYKDYKNDDCISLVRISGRLDQLESEDSNGN